MTPDRPRKHVKAPAYDRGDILQKPPGNIKEVREARYYLHERRWEYFVRNVETGYGREWVEEAELDRWPEPGDPNFDGDDFEKPSGYDGY